jgi:hypothetical protein
MLFYFEIVATMGLRIRMHLGSSARLFMHVTLGHNIICRVRNAHSYL